MSVLFCVVVGVVYAAAFSLLLQRDLLRVLLGVALLGHGANLVVFAAAGVGHGPAPLVAAGAVAPPPGAVDPLPQALVLTAIVIGFGVLGFALALAWRVRAALGTDDLDALQATCRDATREGT